MIVEEYTPILNTLEDIIIDQRLSFRSVADKLDYKNLMSVNKISSKGKEVDNEIIAALQIDQ